MEGFGNLTSVINNALKQVGEDSGMLLGQELTIQEADFISTNKQTYFTDMDDVCFVAEVTSGGDYPGKFQMVVGLRDAIAMSGFLLGIPPARINEKRRLAIMENDDVDAFSEIINQAIGSMNSVFQPSFTGKAHLKVVPPKKFIPETSEITSEEPVPDGDYLLFRARMEMPGMEMEHFDILMPVALAELFDPPAEAVEEPEEAAPPEAETSTEEEVSVAEDAAPGDGESAGAAEPVEPDSGPQTILILDDDEGDRQKVKEFLAARGLQPIDASLDSDVREIFAQSRVKVVVLGIHNSDDRDMAVCIKLKAITQGATLPIIMCAREWTRSSVFKAIKYGARDIVIKPFNEDELVSKVEKFLTAA